MRLNDWAISDLAEDLRAECDITLLPEAWHMYAVDYPQARAEAIASARNADGMVGYMVRVAIDNDQTKQLVTALEEACLAHHLATAEDGQ